MKVYVRIEEQGQAVQEIWLEDKSSIRIDAAGVEVSRHEATTNDKAVSLPSGLFPMIDLSD